MRIGYLQCSGSTSIARSRKHLTERGLSPKRALQAAAITVALFAPSASIEKDWSQLSMFEISRLSFDAQVNAVAWTDNAEKLAVISDFGGTVSVIQTGSWARLKDFHRTDSALTDNSAAFLPNDTLLLPADENGIDLGTSRSSFALAQFNIASGKKIREMGVPPGVPRNVWDNFKISRDGTTIAGYCTAALTQAATIDTASWKKQQLFDLPALHEITGVVSAIAINSKANMLFVGTTEGSLYIFDTQSRRLLDRKEIFNEHYVISALEFNSTFTMLAIGAKSEHGPPKAAKMLKIAAMDNNRLGRTTAVGKLFYGINDLSWDSGDVLAVGSSDGLFVMNLDTNAFANLRQSSGSGFYSVKFGSNGDLAAAYGRDVFIFAKQAKI